MVDEAPGKPLILFVVFIVLVIGLVATAVLLLIGVGFGYALRWILPSLDFGQAVLIGVVASSAGILLVLFIINKLIETRESSEYVPVIDEDELEEILEQIPRRRRRRRRIR